MRYELTDTHEVLNAKHKLAHYIAAGKTIELKEATNNRTGKQNNALHQYFELLAQALSDAGLDMKKTLKPEAEIPWTAEAVKEYLWRPVQKAQLQKDSTTELSTRNIDEVYDTLNRHLGEKFGITVPFPSQETKEGI